ncbi:MAG TPA: hypothetical protein DD979_16740, partial [Gammaproteobacteria bacterium]|nr:hypothetical protein [Gammaproteobacteria bacterium]
FTQGAGAIQGGIVATMLDFGLAFAALSVVDVTQSVATASIAVNYYRPAFAGHYTVRACIDKQGRTLIFASAELFDTRGKTIAMSNSPLIVVNL